MAQTDSLHGESLKPGHSCNEGRINHFCYLCFTFHPTYSYYILVAIIEWTLWCHLALSCGQPPTDFPDASQKLAVNVETSDYITMGCYNDVFANPFRVPKLLSCDNEEALGRTLRIYCKSFSTILTLNSDWIQTTCIPLLPQVIFSWPKLPLPNHKKKFAVWSSALSPAAKARMGMEV